MNAARKSPGRAFSFIVHGSSFIVCFGLLYATTAFGAEPVTVSADRLLAAGLRTVVGKHLTLYTDLPPSPAVDELPAVFDTAVPQWAAYFSIEPAAISSWRMNCFLMRDAARFRAAGLLPAELPPFKNGYSVFPDLWFYEQPNDYNRRHLLLHEGTHGFMASQFGGFGAPWYMEGVAELLATHRWSDGSLTLGIMPRNRDEAPDLGRIKLVKDAIAAGRRTSLAEILNYKRDAHLVNETYGWCWALAVMLDGDPRYRERFRALQRRAADPQFNDHFRQAFAAELPSIARQWVVFADGLEFGSDPIRTAIDFTPGVVLPADGAKLTVAADRGWQNTGIRLEAGKSYRLQATGRYQIAESTDAAGAKQPWSCEPGGVSIRYYRGRPLGQLLAAIEPDAPMAGEPPAMLSPTVVGLETTLRPMTTGTLYLRVNDSDGELHDNAGMLTAEIAASP